MKKFKVTIIDKRYYVIDADSPSEAVALADEKFNALEQDADRTFAVEDVKE